MSAQTLIISRHSPYGGGLARAALDAALAAAAFDHPPGLLFLGAGVLQLIADQDSSAITRRNHARVLASLPLYEVAAIFADQAALARYGLQAAKLAVPVRPLDAAGIRRLLAQYRHLMSF